MATHHPRFLITSPWYQATRDSFESKYLSTPESLERFDSLITAAYLEARAREYIRVVTSLKLSNGRTQQDLADEMGMDHSPFSVAQNYGELGSGPLSNMFGDPDVLRDLSQRDQPLLRQLGRAGLIGAVRQTAAVAGLAGEVRDQMSELPYELLCAAIEFSGEEVCYAVMNDHQTSVIVSTAIQQAPRSLPVRLTKHERDRNTTLLAHVSTVPLATDYLQQLQSRWLESLVYAFASTEGLGYEPMWQQAQYF